MSNAELRLRNEEVGIRVLTQMEILKVLSTLYIVLSTNFALVYFSELIFSPMY